MKRILKNLGLLCIVTLFVACSQNKIPTSYKVTGEYISMFPDVTEEVTKAEEASTDESDVAESTETDTPSAEDADEPIDLSNATLTISYETTNSEGNNETVSLVEESFNGSFEFESETMEPTEVTISLRVSEDADPMEINTVIGTGQDIHFAFIDHRRPRNDQFILAGTSSQVMHPENEFTVSGDLSFLDVDETQLITAYVYSATYNDEGVFQSNRWGPVLVRNNSFSLAGDVEQPQNAELIIQVQEHIKFNRYYETDIIIEPQGNITVAKLGHQTEVFSTTSGSGYHATVIESWQQHPEYIELVNAWATELEVSRNLPEPTETEENEALNMNDEDNEEIAIEAEIADVEEDTEPATEEMAETDIKTTDLAASIEPPAEGCEDADVGKYVTAVPSTSTETDDPKSVTLRKKRYEFRSQTLREIVETNDDSTAQYLALMLGPYADDTDDLAAWKTLAEKSDTNFFTSHISREIESREGWVMTTENDSTLIPGQKVPAFTLANLEGEEVALYDLLGEKDMVLIDFWASWCGPCIADFPDLKKLYAAYTNEDFEIVGVSIDSTEEAWIGGVEDNELPWIQLGELEGWFGPIGVQYGVGWVPKGYLVDSQGCIYEKDIRPAALKEFLVDRYGLDESLVEPEVETEDTEEVSG